MLRTLCLAFLLVGCGAPAPVAQYRPAFVDPALGDAPADALETWQLATGGRFPVRNISFLVGDINNAALTDAPADMSKPAFVTVASWLDPSWFRQALLHELGHVAKLTIDPDSGDPIHYHGSRPSVMLPVLNDCSAEIGEPELDAFVRRYGR